MEHPMLMTYLFMQIDSVLFTLSSASFLSILITVVSLVILYWGFSISDWDSDSVRESKLALREQWKWLPKTFFTLFLVFSILGTIIPNQKTLAVMIGVNMGVNVYKKVEQSPITEKAFKVLEGYVDAELSKVIDNREKK